MLAVMRPLHAMVVVDFASVLVGRLRRLLVAVRCAYRAAKQFVGSGHA